MNIALTGDDDKLAQELRKEHRVFTLREKPDENALEDWVYTRWDKVSVVLDILQALSNQDELIDAVIINHRIPVESGELITSFDVSQGLELNVLKPIFLMRMLFEWEMFSEKPRIIWRNFSDKVISNHPLYVAEQCKSRLFQSYFLEYIKDVNFHLFKSPDDIFEILNANKTNGFKSRQSESSENI